MALEEKDDESDEDLRTQRSGMIKRHLTSKKTAMLTVDDDKYIPLAETEHKHMHDESLIDMKKDIAEIHKMLSTMSPGFGHSSDRHAHHAHAHEEKTPLTVEEEEESKAKPSLADKLKLSKKFSKKMSAEEHTDIEQPPVPHAEKRPSLGGMAAVAMFAHKTHKKTEAAKDQLDDHMVYASDLVSVLDVTKEEAEEMIFIADSTNLNKKNTHNPCIDFSQFKQLVVNWA